MLAAVVNDFFSIAIPLVLFASANIIKVHSVKILEKSNRLEPDQIKSGVIIVNTIFYTILIIFLTRLAILFISLVAF